MFIYIYMLVSKFRICHSKIKITGIFVQGIFRLFMNSADSNKICFFISNSEEISIRIFALATNSVQLVVLLLVTIFTGFMNEINENLNNWPKILIERYLSEPYNKDRQVFVYFHIRLYIIFAQNYKLSF